MQNAEKYFLFYFYQSLFSYLLKSCYQSVPKRWWPRLQHWVLFHRRGRRCTLFSIYTFMFHFLAQNVEANAENDCSKPFFTKRNLFLIYVCLKDFLINESLYYLAKMFMIFYFQHQLVSVNPMETTTTYCCYIARQHGAKKENLSLNQNTCGLTKGSKKCKRWVAFFLQK